MNKIESHSNKYPTQTGWFKFILVQFILVVGLFVFYGNARGSHPVAHGSPTKAFIKINGELFWLPEPQTETTAQITLTPTVCNVAPGVVEIVSGIDTLGFRVNQEGTYVDSTYFMIPVLPGSCNMSNLEFQGSYTSLINPETCTAKITWQCMKGFFPGFNFMFDFNNHTVTLTIRNPYNCDSCATKQFSFAPTDLAAFNDPVPAKFNLSQNYPNPFNSKTNIHFTVPRVSWITLKVYDLLGNEQVTLVNAEKSAGNYQVEFDGGQFSSGIYLYKLEAGSFHAARKFILQK